MRKNGWTYWETGLPSDSETLEDLDALARSLHVSRGEANRLLLIAYSLARRGEWGQLWGFGAGSDATRSANGNGTGPTLPSERESDEVPASRKRGRVAAAALLDED